MKTVVIFDGQSLTSSTGHLLLQFQESALDKMPDSAARSAQGRAAMVLLKPGKGRVVITGDATIFTSKTEDSQKQKLGINREGTDNVQFALNTFHWLSGLVDQYPRSKTGDLMKISQATVQDIPEILNFIRALAKFEKLENEVSATEQGLKETLFGAKKYAEVIFLEVDSKKVGCALFFHSYSTFLAKPGIYLEDLFVLPEHRGKGYGKKLLSHLAKLTVERNCARLEWSVLDWNQSAIDLYLSLGSKPMNEWTTHRLTGEALKALANQ